MHSKAKARWGALGLVLAAAATAAAANHGPSSGDAEAIATIIAIDSAEIVHADLAMTRKLTDPVLAYVQDIRGDHADDAEEIAAEAEDLGVYPSSSDSVRSLETEADETVRTLDELDGASFEGAYLDGTIKCHSNALTRIDRLTRMDLSDGVKAHLKDMRENTMKHLDRAKALRNG
jgi:putative membrane protein